MSAQPIKAASDDLERFCDPQTLAHVGLAVRQRLGTTPGVERVDVEGAEVFVVPGFLLKRDCRSLIEAINRRVVPSGLYRADDTSGFRTSSTHHFDRGDLLTHDFEEYVCDLLGIAMPYSEPIQGQRYQVGQEFKAHHDFFHLGERYWQTEALCGGQRTWTAMAYLNEPREGGETEFPLLGISVRPKAGTLLIWNNMKPDGTPNMKTLHAALPVKRGIKHVITKWFRQEPWQQRQP